MKLSQKETAFNNEVVARFELYNSLFLTLPFYQVKDTGILLPFFTAHCEEGVRLQLSPIEIIESFFSKYEQYINEADRFHLLFRFIQYIERQVVLFDAVEDAAFNKLGHAEEGGSLQALLQQAEASKDIQEEIRQSLKKFSLRLVLTAHPTQFYPGSVLAIITDLTEALKKNDINNVHLLLQQLGKTPFFNKSKPTPVDEAVSLAWFLENVFYKGASAIQTFLDTEFDLPVDDKHRLLELGFWPGGDRDGNPNVTPNSTIEVAGLLRKVLFRCYYKDFRRLKRRVTFRGVENYMAVLEDLFYENSFNTALQPKNIKNEIVDALKSIKDVLINNHDGLFINEVDGLIRKVMLYGCYFASLDIRQDSRILRSVTESMIADKNLHHLLPDNYLQLSQEEKLKAIRFSEREYELPESAEPHIKDTLETIRLMREIQDCNGERAAHRFIISNCQLATDILELCKLFLWSGWKADDLTVDFVPLFETVHDLEVSAQVMEQLYTHPFYKAHLQKRGNLQTIMLGFSDSTKDGGYLMANWSIYKAKVELTAVARKYGVDLAFFDGRGGPPARGGGKTHRFYATMGEEIANEHIQLTIQGQTISSQYGSVDSARYNMEQMINAGMVSALNKGQKDLLDAKQKSLIDKMAQDSYNSFLALRQHPLFLQYLEELSPLKLLSQINISSRPVKRNSDAPLRLEDLRAISFVTAWSQLKQNIPGFYGVGTALKEVKEAGLWEDVQQLYHNSGQFKTMLDNCMMSMSKSDFRVTKYLDGDAKFGEFWHTLRNEYELTKKLLLELTGDKELMDRYPVERRSIAIREKIVLPLVVIQHYALRKLNEERSASNEEEIKIYDKLAIRTIYGIVNAGRNLA
jgi:phosphoenolpyruvate carboxylase